MENNEEVQERAEELDERFDELFEDFVEFRASIKADSDDHEKDTAMELALGLINDVADSNAEMLGMLSMMETKAVQQEMHNQQMQKIRQFMQGGGMH